MNRHLSDDELVDRLFGLTDGLINVPDHLETCHECAQRWNEFRARREQLAKPEEVSTDFLAAQRRKIYARFGEEPRRASKWVPALAAACLLAAGVFLYRPAPPPHQESADAQLFSEVYSMEQSTEPQAADPIHALFEDNQ